MYRHPFFMHRYAWGWSWPLRGIYHRRPSRLIWFAIGAGSATLYLAHREARRNMHDKYWSQCYHASIQPQVGPDTTGLSGLASDPLPTIPTQNGTPGAPSTPSVYPYSHPHHHSHWGWGFARERFPPTPPVAYPNPHLNGFNGVDRTAQTQDHQVPTPPALPTPSVEPQLGVGEALGQTAVPTPTPAPVPAPVVPASTPSAPASVPWGFDTRIEQRLQWEQDRDRLIAKAQDTMAELTESTLDSLASTVEALKAKLAAHKAEREAQQKLLEQQLEEKKKPRRLV